MTLKEIVAENLENAKANGFTYDLTNEVTLEHVAADMLDCTDIFDNGYDYEQIVEVLKEIAAEQKQ